MNRKFCEIPRGWKKITDQMYDELEAINPDIEILQAKEKWGCLCIYYHPMTEETEEIISKYEDLSAKTCCGCGKTATKLSRGYIAPWCDECAKEVGGRFVEI